MKVGVAPWCTVGSPHWACSPQVWTLVGGVFVWGWVPGCPLWSMEIHAAYGATAGQQLDLVGSSGGDVPWVLNTSPRGW